MTFSFAVFAGGKGPSSSPDPNAGGGYHQRPWRHGAALAPGAWYWCISTSDAVSADAATVTRRKQDLVRTYAVVLDDVGSKVEVARVEQMLPAPSAILGTSPGNYQWVYILDGGADPLEVEAALARLAAAGLTDAGAKDVAHVVRMPGSLNDKAAVRERNRGRAWGTRVTLWEPDRLYTVEEIVERVPRVEEKKRERKAKAHDSTDDHARALDLIAVIRNDGRFVERGDWLSVGMALHDATGASGAGLRAWTAWTERAGHEDAEAACREAWDSFKGRADGYTIAEQDGFDRFGRPMAAKRTERAPPIPAAAPAVPRALPRASTGSWKMKI